MIKPEVIPKIEEVIKADYQLRFNSVTNRLETCTTKDNRFKPVSEVQYNTIFTELNRKGLTCSLTELRQILESDLTSQIDPFKEYFDNLEEWNQTIDYIGTLASKVITNNNQLWQKCFKKWIVAVVASLLDHKANHSMLVLSGKQGLGKTTWLNSLVPNSLSNYSYNGTINPRNKDTLVYLSECMLIILDELEILNKKQLGSLKQLVTNPSIRLRRPYSRNADNLLRRASFCGSINATEFLTDSTGNRRFLCFEVTKIDYQSKVDLNGVYAQALHLYNDGFQYWFDDADIQECEENNRKFTVVSMEEELLLSILSAGESTSTYTTTDIAKIIAKTCDVPFTSLNIRSLGIALNKHNFIKTKIRGIQKYKVVPKGNLIL